jgi:hypothetical protein
MPQFAYATVVTTPPDAAHAIALAHSLRRRGSRVPLVVLHPRALAPEALQALAGEAAALGFTTAVVADDDDDEGQGDAGPGDESGGEGPARDDDDDDDGAAEARRRRRPPAQLAVFGPALWQHETVCAVAPRSAVVRRGMDLVFAAPLPTGDWLGAVPLCACRRRRRRGSASGGPSASSSSSSSAAAAGKARASSAEGCPFAEDAGGGAGGGGGGGDSVGGSPVLVDRSPLSPTSPLSPRGLMTPSRALSFSALASQLPVPGSAPTSSSSSSPAGPGARIDPRLLLFSPDERLRDRVLAAAESQHTLRRPGVDGDEDGELARASRILHAAFPARWAPLPATYLASRALRANHPALDGGGGHGGGGGGDGLRIVCVHCEAGEDHGGDDHGAAAVVAEEAGGATDELAVALAAWRAERLVAGGERAREAVGRVEALLVPAPERRRSVVPAGGEVAVPEAEVGPWRIPAELEARAIGALAF